MTMTHKWHYIIQLYINNIPVQYRIIGEKSWINLTLKSVGYEPFPNFNDPYLEWRPKPKYRKYRLAKLFDKNAQTYYTGIINDEKDQFAIEMESYDNFINWISPWLDMPQEDTD